MSFTNIINSFLNVRNKIKDADGNWVDQRKARETLHVKRVRENLDNNDVVVFNEFGKKIIIDSIEYFSESTGNVYPRLNVTQGATGRSNDNIFLALNSTSYSTWDMTGIYINTHGSTYFEAIKYNSSDNQLKVKLTRQIVLPNGGRLTFAANGTGEGREISALVVYRVIEE